MNAPTRSCTHRRCGRVTSDALARGKAGALRARPPPRESVLIPPGGWHLSAQPLGACRHSGISEHGPADISMHAGSLTRGCLLSSQSTLHVVEPRIPSQASAHTRHSDSVPIAHASLTHCPATRHPCGGGVAPDMRRRPDAMRDMLHEHAAIPHKARRGVVNARAPPLTVVAKGEEVGSQKQPRPASTRGAIGNPAGACARATQQCAWFLD